LIQIGKQFARWWTNFLPFIADFLTDDVEELEERKAGVAEPWWAWTRELAERYIQKHGQIARDGRPPSSWIPAGPAAEQGGVL